MEERMPFYKIIRTELEKEYQKYPKGEREEAIAQLNELIDILIPIERGMDNVIERQKKAVLAEILDDMGNEGEYYIAIFYVSGDDRKQDTAKIAFSRMLEEINRIKTGEEELRYFH